MSNAKLIRKVAKAIDAVQLWSRRNDQKMRIEICRYGRRGEDEIVVLRTAHWFSDESAELRKAASFYRAKAAIEAINP